MKLKPSRWMAGVCLLSGGLCISLSAAAPTSAVTYTPNLAPPPPPPMPPEARLAINPSSTHLDATAQMAPITMTSMHVRGATLSDRDYRELREEVGRKPLTAARAFFTSNLSNGAQLEAAGAPLFPIAGENATHQDQVRVPVVGVNW